MCAVVAGQTPAQPFRGSPESRHVLACISGTQDDLRLIRHGGLLSQQLQGRLTVLYVLCPPGSPRPAETLQADRVFARSVGAPLVEVPALSPAAGIVEYAESRAITHLVLSDQQHTPWYAAWHGSLIDALAARLTGVEIYVLGDDRLAAYG